MTKSETPEQRKRRLKPILASQVESYLVSQVEAHGGLATKTISPGGRGYFDRTVLLPGGLVVFCEVKKPRRSVMSVHQRALHIAYRRLGARVAVIKCCDDVDRLLEGLMTAA